MGTSWKKARIGPIWAGAAVEIFLVIMFLAIGMVEDRSRDLAANIVEMVLWSVRAAMGGSMRLVWAWMRRWWNCWMFISVRAVNEVRLKGPYISRFVKETGVRNLLLDRAPSFALRNVHLGIRKPC